MHPVARIIELHGLSEYEPRIFTNLITLKPALLAGFNRVLSALENCFFFDYGSAARIN
jgi:hypothetical protein